MYSDNDDLMETITVYFVTVGFSLGGPSYFRTAMHSTRTQIHANIDIGVT